MQRKLLLALVMFVLLPWCSQVMASDNFLLNYYLEVELDGDTHQLQQRGLSFGSDYPVVIQLGRAECRINLVSSAKDAGKKLSIDIYDRKRAGGADPISVYSVDVDFVVGSVVEFESADSGVRIDFTYRLVRKGNR